MYNKTKTQQSQNSPRPHSQQQKYKQDTGLHVRQRYDDQPFPQFEKPKPIGYFSIVDGPLREYEPSAKQLRYYKPPPLKCFPLDLNKGLHTAIKKPESAYDEGLDNILKFIVDQQGRPLLGTEFICWRGLLRLLMCTPYEFRQDWCIHVTRYKDHFYLHKPDTQEDKYKRNQETEMQQTMCAYGFKFEQYCMAESPFIDGPDNSTPVDECGEFSCVFKTKLGGMAILYGAEMDGVISDQPVLLDGNSKLEHLKFVELKTRQGNLNPHQMQTFNRFKTCNCWCQSFLVGVQDIYVGMRNDKGFVHKIEHLEVRSLPKKGANHWTPTACTTFLIQFLLCLKSIMIDVNCPHTTYAFYFHANTSRITHECFKGKTAYSFLPEWYLELLNRPSTM